jgi:DNA-binding PadR family transcriptional regulator
MPDEKPLEDMSEAELDAVLDQQVKDGLIEVSLDANGVRQFRLTAKGKSYVENNPLKLPNA